MKVLLESTQLELLKSTDLVDCQCYTCAGTFQAQKKTIIQELTRNRGRVKYCSKACLVASQKKTQLVNCAECGKEVERRQGDLKKTTNSFCNMSCSASYTNKNRVRIKKTDAERIISPRHMKSFVCITCESVFQHTKDRKCCSKECQSIHMKTSDLFVKAGQKAASIQSANRRSKNEKLFFEICNNEFKDVTSNEQFFNGWDADVIIHSLKIAVLWNGKWHYEKICEGHSVKQVQNRDSIKIKEIERSGYKAYVIKDMGKYNPKFVEEQFAIFKKEIL